jgi:hypothetical protein
MKPGYVDGKHYTEYVEVLKKLKSDKEYDRAIELLEKLIKATEEESKANDYGVAPWYYEQLAGIYCKQRNINCEIAILERFSQQKHAPGVKPQKLLDKLLQLKANNK